MDIKTVALVKGNRNTPLKYTYDGMFLNIRLDKTYKGGEPYTIYIDYVAKPDELKAQGSAAITDAKGLYFINPRGEEKINLHKSGRKVKPKPRRYGCPPSTDQARKPPRKCT
jgi:hypothetical protein